MKVSRVIMCALLATNVGGLAFAASDTPTAVTTTAKVKPLFANEQARVSYALGATLGQNLRQQNISIDTSSFAKGFNDALSGGTLLMSSTELKQQMVSFQQEVIKKEQNKFQQEAEKNQHAGDVFLQNNKTKPGVITLPDGLQYKVLTAGRGEKPTRDNVVTVDYEGKTIDGKIFDSSYQRGKSTDFRVSDVIQGWQEALQLMPVDSTWEVYIPANLAYGKEGVPGHIGPNETLLFKVHLISIQNAKK